nr:cytochrome c oxidase subunit 1 [Polyrhizophydium stewartii]
MLRLTSTAAKVYHKLEKHDLAIADYAAVIELDATKSKAYLNLGILHMRYFKEYTKALYSLNKSIANDPINLQTYLCRGELYQLMHSEAIAEIAEANPLGRKSHRMMNRELVAMAYVDKAVKDYSRAIHLCPNNYLLFLYRGRLLLKQGLVHVLTVFGLHRLMAEATMDFHAAFDLNSSIAQTFIQRALVLCFQRKYKQVIDEFDERKKTQSIDDPALLLLIAKARIRCGDFRGALRDLSSSLDYSQNDPQVFLQRGICFEHLRDWSSASIEFSKCITLMPTYSKAYYHRGLCKLYEGNDTGVADLDLAIQYDEKFFDAYLTRASYHHAKGMYAKGIEDCNEALKLEPTSIRSHLLRGACKCKLNQYGLAITDFSKAINIDKTSHFAFYNRAVTYQLLNDPENAIKDYSIVLLLNDDSNAYRNRALIYWKKGDHENALLDLYAARDHFPQDAKLRGLLGLCLQKVGRNQESIDEFSMALDLNPFMHEALLGRGNVYASMGNLRLARRDYARVIHMYPRCAEAYVNIAYSMQTEGKPLKAWEIFTIALIIDKHCTAALEGRAIVHLTMKNAFAALIDITRAISNAQEISPSNAEFLTNRGVIFQALNDDVSALQSYKAAIAADGSYGLAFFNAANLYMRQKLWEHAISYFDKAIEANSQDKAALLNRGICRVMLNDTRGALRDLDIAAQIDPNSPQVHFNRGHLLQSLGKYAEAERAFTKVVELVPRDSAAYMRRGQTWVAHAAPYALVRWLGTDI